MINKIENNTSVQPSIYIHQSLMSRVARQDKLWGRNFTGRHALNSWRSILDIYITIRQFLHTRIFSLNFSSNPIQHGSSEALEVFLSELGEESLCIICNSITQSVTQ